MPLKSLLDSFWRTDALLEPENRLPDISDGVQQTLARNLVFDAFNGLFRLLRSDPGGRAFVSDGPVIRELSVVRTVSNNDVTPVLLVPANLKRQYVILISVGMADSVFKIQATSSVVQSFFAPAGTVYKLSGYTGDIYTNLNAGLTQNVGVVQAYEY